MLNRVPVLKCLDETKAIVENAGKRPALHRLEEFNHGNLMIEFEWRPSSSMFFPLSLSERAPCAPCT